MEGLLRSVEPAKATAIEAARASLDSAVKEAQVMCLLYKEACRVSCQYSDVSHTLLDRHETNPEHSLAPAIVVLAALTRDRVQRCRVFNLRRQQQCARVDFLLSLFERAWVPVLCDKIYSTLPREVRDMIWSNLHREHHCIEASDLYTAVKAAVVEADTKECGSLPLNAFGMQTLNRPYFDEQTVGLAVVREVAEAWYKTISLSCKIFTRIHLREYLSNDRWGLDLQPFKLIRRACITFDDNDGAFDPLVTRKLRGFRCLLAGALVHIRIIDKGRHDFVCLGCHQSNPYCLGNQDDFLSRAEHHLRTLTHRFQILIALISELEDAGLRSLVTFEYHSGRRNSVTTLTLREDDNKDTLNPSTWLEILKTEQNRIRERAIAECSRLYDAKEDSCDEYLWDDWEVGASF